MGLRMLWPLETAIAMSKLKSPPVKWKKPRLLLVSSHGIIELHDSSDHAVFMEIFWIQFFDRGIPLGISRVFLYNVLIPVTTVWGPHTSIKLRMDSFSVLIGYQNQHLKKEMPS